jgi:hypothetical protein
MNAARRIGDPGMRTREARHEPVPRSAAPGTAVTEPSNPLAHNLTGPGTARSATIRGVPPRQGCRRTHPARHHPAIPLVPSCQFQPGDIRLIATRVKMKTPWCLDCVS